MPWTIPTIEATVNFPNTPQARRIAAAISAQHARRAAAHQSILQSPPATEPATNIATPMPSAFNNTHAHGTSMAPRQLFAAPAESEQKKPPDPIQFVEPDDTDAASEQQMNSLAVNAMLDGSDQIFQQSSQDVYDALISIASVPREVADQKKNKAVSVHAFISRVKDIDPQIVFPTSQQGKLLRNIIKTVVSEIKREYKTNNHLLFMAQFTLAVLVQTTHTAKIQAQLHRFMFCQSEQDICQVADYCALGKAAPLKIDHSVRVDHLPGFKLFADEPALMLQLTTALLDYVCFMSNSDIQTAYANSKSVLAEIVPAAFDCIQAFGDAEEIAYNSHSSFAAAAKRSTIDQVDRGITILSNLSNDLKTKLNKKARKLRVPENCQTRDWVISQLIVLEEIDDPAFSWYKKDWRSNKACRHFETTGKCPYANCKYSHEVSDQPANSAANSQHQAPASMATMTGPGNLPARKIEDLSAADVVDIQCRTTLSPECETHFKASPSYWSSIKNNQGEPFQTPKSCLPCRKHARLNNSSMITCMPTDISPAPDESAADWYSAAMAVGCAENADTTDDADDDYLVDFYADYDLNMSGE